jgi:hypothetical protein
MNFNYEKWTKATKFKRPQPEALEGKNNLQSPYI